MYIFTAFSNNDKIALLQFNVCPTSKKTQFAQFVWIACVMCVLNSFDDQTKLDIFVF